MIVKVKIVKIKFGVVKNIHSLILVLVSEPISVSEIENDKNDFDIFDIYPFRSHSDINLS